MDNLIHGLTIGSIIAFVAFGYALIYSILRFINFAHGEIIMVGAYICYFLYHTLGISSFFLSCFFAMLITGMVGVGLEKIAFKPLRNRSRLSMLLSSLAVSLILQSLASLIFGTSPRILTDFDPTITVLSKTFYVREIVVMIVLPFLAIAFFLSLKYTQIGLAIRAIASNQARAAHIGIPINTIISISFFIASSLACLAGIALGMEGGLTPSMGFKYSIWAFAVSVIAGLGSMKGVLIGGLLYGILLNYAIAYGSGLFADALSLVAVALILLIRGKGFFQIKLREF